MRYKNLEDKCRYYQGLSDYRLMPNSYVIVHCDGRSFSKLIKNRYEKPFDDDFIEIMNETARFLCKEVQGCKGAFVQSDEISLLLTDLDGEFNSGTIFFEGRLCKMQSIIASLATGKFNQLQMASLADTPCSNTDLKQMMLDYKPVLFDCKAWSVGSDFNEAFCWFLYRQIDCIRNSKQQFCQTYLPHKNLLRLDTDKQVEITANESGNDWNLIPDDKKYGRFIIKTKEEFDGIDNNGDKFKYFRSVWKPVTGILLTEDNGREELKKLFLPNN